MRSLAVAFEALLCFVCIGVSFAMGGSAVMLLAAIVVAPDYQRDWLVIPPALGGIALYAALCYGFGRATMKGLRIIEQIRDGLTGPGAVLAFSGDSPLLGVGICFALVGIAAGQMQKVNERARVSEARTMASQIRQAQERYFVRYGKYLTDNQQFPALDISFSGPPPAFGMRNFLLTTSPDAACEKGYRLTFTRCDGSKGPPGCSNRAARMLTRYGSYQMTYDHCSDRTSFGDCSHCETDFAQ